VHDTVNVTLDPTLKQRVLDVSLFAVTCSACGHAELAQHDLLYHDMAKVTMLHLTSPARAAGSSEALRQGLASLPTRHLYRLRIVTSVHDLREKIFVFDAELNDGLVEIMKVALPGNVPALAGASIRFQGLAEGGDLAFAVLRPGTAPDVVAVPRDYYDSLRDKAFADMFSFTEARGEWLSVDADTIHRYLASKG
jgi:hypothetical protein